MSTEMNTLERELVDRMLAGEARALEEFVDSYLPALYRFASHRLSGNRGLTREIVQTTLCKVLSKLETFRGDSALLTWMATICRNEIAMHYRRRSHRPWEVEWATNTENLADGTEPNANPNPERALLRDERAHLVHMVLDLLPSHYSRALEWKYIDELSVQEIATRLEIGIKAAESLLTRARQSFRVQYDLHLEELAVADDQVTVSSRRAVSDS